MMTLNSENIAESCKRCNSHQQISVENALDYHEQIERLQAELKERKNLQSQMDKAYTDNMTRYEAESAKNQEEYAKLKYRHEALLEAFKNQQKINHCLEDKLLNVVSEISRRYEALEAKCKVLATNLDSANAKIAELTAENAYQDDDAMATPDNDLPRHVPVSLGFGSGLMPMYHSSPDLCGMAEKHKQRLAQTAKATKQTYSPFAIQTFPPTLMCDTSSFNSGTAFKRVRDSDASEEGANQTLEGGNVRSRSNTENYSCGPCLTSQMPASPRPVISTLINERANDNSFDLKTHRVNTGSIFTV